MKDVIKILTLRNQIEADILDKVLKKEKIPFFIKSFHDSVYNGLFEIHHEGYGVLEAPKDFRKKILKIYNNLIIRPKNKIKGKKVNRKKVFKELKTILIFIFVLVVIILILFSRSPVKKRYYYHKKNINIEFNLNNQQQIL